MLEVEWQGGGGWREIIGLAPHISGCIVFSDSPHDEPAYRWFGIDAVLLSFEPAIEPANHMFVFGPCGVWRISELPIL